MTDGANAVPNNDTGTITEAFADNSYWLGPNIPTTSAYFVIDLGRTYQIAQIDLFNTSNGGPGDRGTGNFTVKGSNTLVSAGALGSDLGGTIVSLASGTLTAQPTTPPLVDQSFASSDTVTAVRYIRFDALSINGPSANNGVGLNEIRIFAVPEPASLGLLAVGGVAMLRRSSRGRRLAAS